MKWPFLLIWLAVLCVTTVAAAANVEEEDDNHNNNISDDDDDLIEENPNFEPWGENDSDYDHYDDDDDDESVPEEMNDAVLSPFQKSRQKRMAVWWKRNQMKIVSLVALYAFRHEIGRMIRFSARKHLTDPVSGKLQRPSLTAILKLVIFIDVMRRFTKGDSQTTATAVMLRSNPLLGLLMTNVLRPSNSAYIPPIRQHYTFERLNDRYRKDGWALQKALDPQGQYFTKEQLKQRTPCFATTVIVMDMTGLDTSVSSMESIQDQVSFLIGEHRGGTLAKSTSSKKNETTTTMEVVIRLESPGGSASDYALAAAQVLRLRKEEGVTVTIVVDKVAASGGYMIACTASPGRLLAAPFAMVGSIGVIGQSFNIHETLTGWGVKPLVFRGGKDKAPLGLVGEVTEEGIQKVQQMVDDTHLAFKQHVVAARPCLQDSIDEYATGRVWLGSDAMDVGLIDRIATSDEYIDERMRQGARILKLQRMTYPRYPFQRPITTAMSSLKQRVAASGSLASSCRMLTDMIGNILAVNR